MKKARKHQKRIIFTLLLAILLATSVPAAFAYYNWVPMWVNGPSGTMGTEENPVTWAVYYDYAPEIDGYFPKPGKLTVFGDGTFEKIDCWDAIDVIELDVAGIGENAFENLYFNLCEPISISKKLTYVGENAFLGKENITVAYEGTEEEWRQIDIREGNEALLEAYDLVDSNHTWNSGVITTPATCKATGEKTYTCTVCGKTKTETIVKSAHVYETVGKKPATCSEEGYTGDRVCKNCGYVQSTGSVIAKKAHTWNDGVITTPATCAAEGVKTFTCTVCSATKTETVAKTTNHKYGYEYYDNDGELWERYVCSICGNIKAEKKHVHDYQFSGPVENLSFFHEAEYTKTCRCGHVETCTYQLQVDDSLTKQAYVTEIMRYADNCRSLGLRPHAGYYWAAIGAKEIGSGAQYEHFQSLSRSFQLFEIRAVCENFGQGSSEVIGGTTVKEMFKIPLPKDYNAELLTVYKLEGNAETILEYSIEDNYVVIETAYPSGRFYLAIVDPQHVHVHTENCAAVPATCTEHGYTAGVYCNDCGTWISGHDDLGTNRENHNYVNGKCSRCGNTQIIAAKDSVTDVSVTYEYDAFAPGTQIAVKELYSTPTSRAWSISPMLNGQKVQPSKPVQVKLPIPEGWSKKDIIVRHTDSFGRTEYPAFTVEGNYVVFMVSSFSEYSIELKEDDSPEQTTDSNTQPAGNACKYCGEVHTGFFGKLIGFFHSILALFGLRK